MELVDMIALEAIALCVEVRIFSGPPIKFYPNRERNNDMQMSPPWIIFVREMEALFANDSDVRVEYNNDEKS